MVNRRKIAYIAGVAVLCWVAIGVLIGIFLGLAHLLNNTTATIIVFQLIVYSALFGFLGTQLYKWKGKRDGWPPAKAADRGLGISAWRGSPQALQGRGNDGSGWK